MDSRMPFPGEGVINQWEYTRANVRTQIVLTNLRVWMELRGAGAYSMTSAPLDEVQWCELHRAHYPLFLVLAALFALIGILLLMLKSEEASAAPTGLCLFVALLLVIGYFLTRWVLLHIGSGNGLITARVPGGAHQQAQQFVSQVEQAAIQARARA